MIKHKSHSFDVQIAVECGMVAAVLMETFYFWIDKNRSDGTHYHDGRYWTYSSVKALLVQYPYLTRDKINTALKKLVDKGLILEGSYSENPYDRTKWYALTDLGLSYYESPDENMGENPKSSNGKSEMYNDGKSEMNNITIYNSNSFTDTKKDTILGDSCESADGNVDHPSDVDVFFDSVWKLYPKKYGKSAVKKTQRKKLQKVGYDVLKRCIDRYKNDIATHGTDIQYVMYGSTFFNGRYVDFMDEDTSSEKTEEVTGYVDY